jgi:streptogramin lyase
MGNALAFRGDLTADGSIVVVDTAGRVQRSLASGLIDPTGMTVVGNTLWVNDVDKIRSFDLTTRSPGKVHDLSAAAPGPMYLNDLVVDRAGQLWATDIAGSRIHVVRADGEVRTFDLPREFAFPNGIAVHPTTNQLWFVTSTQAGGAAVVRITSGGYELVRREKAFVGLDGIVFTPKTISVKPKNGKKAVTKVVTAAVFSDSTTGKIWSIADGKLALRATLAGAPADIGYAAPLGRLLVPLLQAGQFTTLKP